MLHKRIDPEKYPPLKGESWWVVHPNNPNASFRVPMGAVSPCLKDFLCFLAGKAYSIVGHDNHSGWITLRCGNDLYDMPQYLFSRHFDAEAFVCGEYDASELEKAKPFSYQPTLPPKPSFQDGT